VRASSYSSPEAETELHQHEAPGDNVRFSHSLEFWISTHIVVFPWETSQLFLATSAKRLVHRGNRTREVTVSSLQRFTAGAADSSRSDRIGRASFHNGRVSQHGALHQSDIFLSGPKGFWHSVQISKCSPNVAVSCSDSLSKEYSSNRSSSGCLAVSTWLCTAYSPRAPTARMAVVKGTNFL
jgi:hypothetical protein